MSKAARIELYKKIEAHRKRPLLVYVTSKREGASAFMAHETLQRASCMAGLGA
jgi:hypothetical protein